MPSRRAVLRLSSGILPAFLGEGEHRYAVTGGALPPDARVVDCRMAFGGREVELLLESDSFDEVPEGELYPAVTPTLARTDA